jgi:hypothetical protein
MADTMMNLCSAYVFKLFGDSINSFCFFFSDFIVLRNLISKNCLMLPKYIKRLIQKNLIHNPTRIESITALRSLFAFSAFYDVIKKLKLKKEIHIEIRRKYQQDNNEQVEIVIDQTHFKIEILEKTFFDNS